MIGLPVPRISLQSGHRNYRSYDEVMIKLPYDEFVTIYDHHNIFNMVIDAFLACLFNVHYLIFLSIYGS